MSIRVRANGQMLCAAKHPALPDDLGYIDDGLQYILAVEQRVLIPDPDEAETGRHHWRRKGEPFRGLGVGNPQFVGDPVTSFGYDPEFWK